MDYELEADGEQRLRELLNRIGEVLGSEERRASFALYAMGLLTEGERKSVEPIAARCCGDPHEVDRLHQRLLHFLSDSPWSDEEVRRIAARYAVEAMQARERIETWILDDTGFIKQGTHSVGVQRQYTGSIGKVTSCQIGVSLSVATRTEHVPVDFALYLPKCWTDDVKRRAEARIPDAVEFQTKPELALELIRQAVKNGAPPRRCLGRQRVRQCLVLSRRNTKSGPPLCGWHPGDDEGMDGGPAAPRAGSDDGTGVG